MLSTDLISIVERFESFQKDAVNAIVRDFGNNPRGRYLLVIPTAGGKTFTAAKAINKLFDVGILNSAKDCVLWTAHRTELLDQAKVAFGKLESLTEDNGRYDERVLFKMILSAPESLSSDESIRLVIIDEAHHGAADSYQPIFRNRRVGILGLTATPSRHDGVPLDFERESYSIGFPDLVKKGVILRPEIITVDGGKYDFDSLEEPEDLEQLDNAERNDEIIRALLQCTDRYKKVIIYVGTQSHVVSLYRRILNSELKEAYESISYITGGGNSRNQERSEYIRQEKEYRRSIIVNVHVLSEGYDDPSVNTVVMATPTRSKLYYMQAIGRAIRIDLEDPLKKAFIIEVEDELPNIRYRINNRWLYADVSDALEPAVLDIEFTSEKVLTDRLKRLYKEYHVSKDSQVIPKYDEYDRYSMLLFRIYRSPEIYHHYPILITNKNRLSVSNMFNYLSERMAAFKKKQIYYDAAFRMVGQETLELVSREVDRKNIYSALENSVPDEEEVDEPLFIAKGRPWITFVTFHYREAEDQIPRDLSAFVSDMVNRDEVLEAYQRRDFEPGSYLLRLPLPLKSSIGRIVTADELIKIEEVLQKLTHIKKSLGNQDHQEAVYQVLSRSVFPIETVFGNSLVLIARTEEAYKYPF